MSHAAPSTDWRSSEDKLEGIRRRTAELIAAATADPGCSEALLREALAELQRAVDVARGSHCRSGRDAAPASPAAVPDGERPWPQSSVMLEAVLEGTPLAMLLLDGDRRVRHVNRAGALLAELSQNEAQGLRIGEALHCPHASQDPRGCGFGSECASCVVCGSVSDTLVDRLAHVGVRATLPLARPSGLEEFHLLVSSTPVELAGELLALVALEDITKHIRSAESLRAIADYTYDWESWFAPDGRLVWVNPAVENLTGYSPEDCREMPDYPLPIVHAADRAELGELLRAALTERTSINDHAFSITRKDGTVGWMAISWLPICDQRGKHIGLRTSVRDISERKRAEQERQAHVEFLENLDRINRAIQQSSDMERMPWDVVRITLSIFECDRAWLLYPCDPDAPTYRVPVEVTRAGCTGACELDLDLPMKPGGDDISRLLLVADGPLAFGPGGDHPLFPEVTEQFGVQSQLITCIRPKIGPPWMFGMHQCSHPRRWTSEERDLFKEIGRRLGDGLSSALAYRELQESEQRFRALVEQAADPVFLLDGDGQFLDVNQSACDHLGYSRDELLAMNVRQIDESVEGQRHKEQIWDRIRPGEPATLESVHHCKDGSTYPVEVRLGALELDGRRLLLGLTRDISERRRAVQELRESEQRYRIAQAVGHFGNWEYDVQTARFWGSDEAKRIYGFDPRANDFSADEVEKCIPERERVHQALIDLIEKGKPYTLKFEIHPIDGAAPKFISSIAELRRNEHGEPTKVVGVIQDITEHRRAAEERQAHLRFLECMDRINRAIQGTTSVDQMMGDVLDVVLATFDCDRAYFVYPCDPDAPTWCAPMERTKPEYPGAAKQGLDYPVNSDVANAFRAVLSDPGPVAFGQDGAAPIPDVSRNQFGVRAQLAMAVYPTGHTPYMVGVHQCSHERTWTAEERKLFEAIGQRLSDALAIVLSHRELHESEARLRGAERIARLGNWEWDIVNNRLKWSDEVFRIFGVSPHEFTGAFEAFTSVIHPADRARVETSARQALAHDSSESPESQIDYRIVRADGAVRYVHEEAEIVFDQEGKPLRRVGTVQDITERKSAEEALRASERRFGELFDRAAVPLCLVNKEGAKLEFNERFATTFGYSRGEVPTLNEWWQLAYPDPVYREEVLSLCEAALRRATEADADLESIEYSVTCKNGDVRRVVVSGSAVGQDFLLTFFDITERQKAEQEREQLTTQLYQSQKMEAVGQLASGVSHDLNNLLMVIGGNAELMEVALPDCAAAQEPLGHIMAAVRQASGVTRSLLTFSSRIAVEKKPVELRGLVQETKQLIQRMMPATISLATDPPDQPPVWLSADRTQLQQVIINLAINARDAMPEGGTLRISVMESTGAAAATALSQSGAAERSTDRVARLIVSDTGVGMPPEVRNRLFEPFFTTKSRGQGTGLGLAIVHGIVSEHGGAIDVDTAPGKGTTCTISLPVGAAAESDSTEETTSVEDRARGELVLVAEDNDSVRGMIASALDMSGFRVLEAVDGASLAECLRERLADLRLLVLDVDLPQRSGLDCLREIRAQGATTPAFIVTGGIEVAGESELDEYTTLLRKPFNISKLQRLAIDAVSGVREHAARP